MTGREDSDRVTGERTVTGRDEGDREKDSEGRDGGDRERGQ